MNKQQKKDVNLLLKRRINKIYSRVKGKPLTPIREEELNEINNIYDNIITTSSTTSSLHSESDFNVNSNFDLKSVPSVMKTKEMNKMNSSYDDIENIKNKRAKVLVTGGGAFNKHLIEKINLFNKLDTKYTVPNKKLVIFKEAIVFGFLGLLRFLDKQNIENSVTGSTNSSSSGLILDNKII